MLRRNKGRKMAAAAVTGILTLYFAWLALTVETERTLRSVLFAVFFVITVMLVLSMRGYFIDQRTKRMDRNLTSGYRIYHIDEDGIGFESQAGSASDTLEIVTHHKLPYVRPKGLKEWNFGAFEGKGRVFESAASLRGFL